MFGSPATTRPVKPNDPGSRPNSDIYVRMRAIGCVGSPKGTKPSANRATRANARSSEPAPIQIGIGGFTGRFRPTSSKACHLPENVTYGSEQQQMGAYYPVGRYFADWHAVAAAYC